MTYQLAAGVLGPYPSLDISESEYEELLHARNILLAAQSIEDKFGLFLENFFEYEECRFSLALRTFDCMTRQESFRDGVFLLNRRLVNLLTTCRMYIDQVKQDVRGIVPELSTQRVEQLLSEQYDRLFGYRVMEALRNYAQHQALPIKLANYRSAWESFGDQEFLSFRANPKLRIGDLGSSFKQTVKDELIASAAEEFDLSLFVRQYIEGLSSVHGELRDQTRDAIDQAIRRVASSLDRYSAAAHENRSYCVAFKLSENDSQVQSIGIGLELTDRVTQLRERALPVGISRWVVSNRVG